MRYLRGTCVNRRSENNGGSRTLPPSYYRNRSTSTSTGSSEVDKVAGDLAVISTQHGLKLNYVQIYPVGSLCRASFNLKSSID